MRTFHLKRSEDVSGTSGTGKVAEGVEFSNGWAAITWLSPYGVVAFYQSVTALIAVHGHDGKTEVVFDDEKEVKDEDSSV